jgi:hypothetical protein
MPRSPGSTSPTRPPWDLEHCPVGQLAQRYADLQAFVSWLQRQDVGVPSCWYAHGWTVHRLAALQAWRTLAYGPGTHPRDAADWWAVGLAALQRDWEPLLGHQGRHPPPDAPWDDPVPIPEFAEFVRAQVAARAHRDAEPGSA